jgi:hypothetical protein
LRKAVYGPLIFIPRRFRFLLFGRPPPLPNFAHSLRLYGLPARRYSSVMSTITAILEPDADGTLHLPLPPELRGGRIEITATLKPAEEISRAMHRATPEMLRKRQEAFAELRRLNPFRDIPDPVAWQREIRKDRPLPGRD